MRARLRAVAALTSLAALPPASAAAAGFIEGRAVETRHQFPSVERLVIEGDFLDVRVFGTRRGDIEAELRLSSRMQERNQPRLVQRSAGSSLTLRLEWNELIVSRASRAWGPSLVLSVPESTNLDVRTSTGDVQIQDMQSERVDIRSFAGDVFVGDSAVSDELEVEGGTGGVTVRGLRGSSSIRTQDGQVTVVDTIGDVRVVTATGARSFRGVEGDIRLTGGGGLDISNHRGHVFR